LILYLNEQNWMKASVEYENQAFSRLGSVVTNLGYSDWASTDIPASVSEMGYRLSRRGMDFYIENSLDGIHFKQMRMFHLHKIVSEIKVEVYACSPLESCFKAEFSDFRITDCHWPEYNLNNNQ